MLNGKTSFDIPNVPADHVLLRFNVLFAYVFDAVSSGKGMMQLKIDPPKNQTIHNLLRETFPSLKCFDNEKLCVINPKLVAYIHALVIDSISILFEPSINSRAHEHEDAMAAVYSKMIPDLFTSQLQAVLTAFYEDIMGVQGASGCAKAKVMKRKFEDQVDTNAADAAPPPPPPPPPPRWTRMARGAGMPHPTRGGLLWQRPARRRGANRVVERETLLEAN